MSDLRTHLTAGLQAVTECFASLCNLELTSSLPATTHVGPAALEAVGDNLVWCSTKLLGREHKVGLILSEPLAIRLGCGMMMMPEEPAMTEELWMALDEAINVAVGVWNGAIPDDTLWWDNAVAARNIGPRGLEESLVECAEKALGVVQGTISIAGVPYPVALVGHGTWPGVEGFAPPKPLRDGNRLGETTQLLLAQALGIDLSRPPAQSAPPPRQPAPRPAPSADHEPASDEQIGAMLVLVDRTGALREWLSAQLKNPEYSFHKVSGSVRDQEHCRAIVLVEPTDLAHASIRAGRMLIMDRAQESS